MKPNVRTSVKPIVKPKVRTAMKPTVKQQVKPKRGQQRSHK